MVKRQISTMLVGMMLINAIPAMAVQQEETTKQLVFRYVKGLIATGVSLGTLTLAAAPALLAYDEFEADCCILEGDIVPFAICGFLATVTAISGLAMAKNAVSYFSGPEKAEGAQGSEEIKN